MAEISTSASAQSPIRQVMGLVLAGGQSRRMGGHDKACLELAGKPMLAHVLGRISPQVAKLVISSNRERSGFDHFGFPVIADDITGFQGPLAGLAAAIRYAKGSAADYSHVLSVSTDTPFVPRTLLADLTSALVSETSAAVAQSRHDVHWTIGLWPIGALSTIETAIADRELKVQRVLETLSPQRVDFADIMLAGAPVDPFFNINTPDEAAEAERLLVRRGVPIIGIAGWKNVGKTTLACRLIEAFSGMGMRVGVIKHSHHRKRDEGAETDTARHAAHGAIRVAFVSPSVWGIEPNIVNAPEPPLAEIVRALGDVDMIVVEGMKKAAIPKIEVRAGVPSPDRPPLADRDPHVLAVASDEQGITSSPVPVFRRDDVQSLVRLVLSKLGA